MCNISLPSNSIALTTQDRAKRPGEGGTGQEVSGGERKKRGAKALACRYHPHGPGNLDREEYIHVFLFHQQIIQQT